ncbi:MAG: phosphotransferase, partial [Propionibacteriaceae bacterium]|nr:phosphotransferase [Propionibacteriaceae bacterium]
MADEALDWLRSLFPASQVLDIRVQRERTWATNWRVTVDEGEFWFKRGHPSLTRETALLEVLQRAAPEHVLVPFAMGPGESGWILTRDQGPTLATVSHDEGPRHYRETAVALALTQQAASATPHVLAQVGLRRFDPVRAVVLLDELLSWFATLASSNPSHVGVDTRRSAMAGASALVDRWVAVASHDPGTGLDHNDLHLGNVFRGPLISDWGDAVLGHPFSSLRTLVFAAGQVFGDEASALVRKAYLEQWGDPADLHETLELAMQLAAVQRLYAWRRLGSPELVAEYAEYVVPLVTELGRPV